MDTNAYLCPCYSPCVIGDVVAAARQCRSDPPFSLYDYLTNLCAGLRALYPLYSFLLILALKRPRMACAILVAP